MLLYFEDTEHSLIFLSLKTKVVFIQIFFDISVCNSAANFSEFAQNKL